MTNAISDEATRGCCEGRGRFNRPQQPIDRERLPSGLGGDPAREHGEEARRPHRHREQMQPGGNRRACRASEPQAEQAKPHHQESQSDHDPERPENDRHRRPVLARRRRRGPPAAHRCECFRISEPSLGISTAYLTLPAVLVGQAEQHQRRAIRLASKWPSIASDLGGLMLQRIEAVLVAGENLDRRHQRRHPHRHRKHHPRAAAVAGRATGETRRRRRPPARS